MWKGGSELQYTTLFPVDPLDPVDHVACAEVAVCLDETILIHPWNCLQPALQAEEALGEPWQPSERLLG